MLTKTVDGALTTYGYDNGWKDQLTSVNDTQLTYDENGNLLTYGDMQYEWFCTDLSKITDGENTYSYTYNEDGIRESKIVNGEKIIFNTVNGAVVAQSNNNLTDTMYFQYSNGVPVGFIHNDTQYLYITNLSGDVVGITDIDGNLIAEYTYDEWGKLLAITPAEEDNAEQLTIAETNPLRYRGYYYDNETGLYYLQSRYYNPEIGRFISADDFDYIDTDGKYTTNAYGYCANNPLKYSDFSGNYYYGREYDLGGGWKAKIVRPSNAKEAHVKVYRGKEVYSQDENGKPTDNSKGSPSNSAKKKLKEQTGWDWDAKAKSYEEQQKENSENFSLDMSSAANVIIIALLIVLSVSTGIGLFIFILLALEVKPPVGVPI